MKILLRLPNWLGDMVMAVGAVQRLLQLYPQAELSVVAKKGIHSLVEFYPPVKHVFVFSKDEFRGPLGLWRFGRSIEKTEAFDLFFSFPDSFSSALIGLASGSKKRVGYRNEGRSILLTNSYKKPEGLHRVLEYTYLIENYFGATHNAVQVTLSHPFIKKEYVVLNVNSEASSRRLTVAKAAAILTAVRAAVPHKIYLIGATKEAPFVAEVLQQIPSVYGIESVAGKTSLPQLAELLASAQALLSTDSGPAHLANALRTQTVVLFGAGNEANTAPYNKAAVQTIRLGQLACEPCLNNVCRRYGTPKCLELLDVEKIILLLKNALI